MSANDCLTCGLTVCLSVCLSVCLFDGYMHINIAITYIQGLLYVVLWCGKVAQKKGNCRMVLKEGGQFVY